MENTQLTDLFNNLFGTEEEQQEASQYSFSTPGQMDDAVGAWKENETDRQRFRDLHKEQKAKLDYDLECKELKIDKKQQWLEYNLKNSVMQNSGKKETKTQFKLSLFEGDISITKSKTNLLKPELTELEITEKFPEFAKSKTVITLDWAELKKGLKIVDGAVILVKTGVDLSTTISTELTAEKVTIK